MDFKNILQLLGIGVLALAIGYGTGYFYAPEKIKEIEKIVEKEKTTKQEYKKKTKKFDKEGKVTEETEETGTKESKSNTQKNEKTREQIKEKKMWAAKAGVGVPVKDPNRYVPRVGGEVRLPIFNSWVGTEVDLEVKDPKLGMYLRLEF